jgi:hypothetical protein
MRVWYCIDHDGHWPVGTASIAVAATEDEARADLIEELRKHGIRQPKGDFTLVELNTSQRGAVVLLDGDY